MRDSSTMPRRRTLLGVAMCVPILPAAAQSAGQPPIEVTPPGVDTPRPLPGPRSIGREDAPVTVTEFHSYTCSNCAAFHTATFPRIKAAYVAPGLVRFVLRDFPIDRVALAAAALVHCAGPEQFERLVGQLYAQQKEWVSNPDARGWLGRAGQAVGTPASRIEACLSDRGFTDPVLASRLEAERAHGVEGTPSFLIGGRLYQGALSFERFAEIVAPLLPPGSAPRGQAR